MINKPGKGDTAWLGLLLLAAASSAPAQQVGESAAEGSFCDEPVLMLVIGQLKSTDALKEYGAALRELDTYPEQQGYYEFSTRPSETFEGRWPENQFVVGARFPCVEAARGFWYSEEYQAIRHLRAGAGTISVTVHPMNEIPHYVGKAAPLRLLPPQPTQSPP